MIKKQFWIALLLAGMIFSFTPVASSISGTLTYEYDRLSYQWLAQCTRIDDLTEPVTQTEIIHHHWIGVCGQNQSPYINMPINLESVISLEDDQAMQTAVFVNSSGHHSAFEWGIIEQTQPPYSAVSTVKLIDQSNEKSDKIFEAYSSNFTAVKALLKPDTYNARELSHIQAYISAGYRVILPEDGNLGEGSWQGTGFLTISPSANSVGHIISGGFKGGFGTEIWDADPTDLLGSGTTGENSDSNEKSPEPIDLVTGNYLYNHTDLMVGSNPSPLGLAFSRAYNSGDHLVKGSQGLGWTNNFEIRARVKSDGFQAMGKDSVIDAAAVITEILASASILSNSVSRNNLVIATIAHRWAMDSMIDNMVLFSQPGISSQFVKLPDSSFNGPPDSADQLVLNPDNTIQIIKKHGTILMFNADGTIDSIRDTNSNTVNFSYAGNQLSQVSNGTGHSLAFTYANGLLTRVDDSALRFITYTYDAAGNLTGFTDAAGETTTFEYAGDGMLSSVFYPTDPLNPFVTNQYDAIGKISFQTDANNNVYTYGFSGFRAEEINPEDKSTIWTFNSEGQTLSTTDTLGNTTQKSYDALGRVKQIVQPGLNETLFEYDLNHNILVTRSLPVPGSLESPVVMSFTYDPIFNQVLSRTDPLGRITNYTYDSTGNLTKIKLPLVDAIQPEINYSYNARGQATTITDPEDKITQNSYDPLTGDLLQVIDDFGGENIQVSYAYDTAGNRTAVTDPNGNTTTLSYDALSNPTSSIASAPFNYETQFIYDTASHLTQIRQQDNSLGNLWLSHITTYTPTYKKASAANPEDDTSLYEYDAVDRLWKITDPENNTTEYSYNDAGQLIRKTDANNDMAEAYTYTTNGRLQSITDGNLNTTTFLYDGLDRLKEKQYPDGTKEIFSYDAAGNLVQKETRAEDTIIYTYDPLDRMTTKTTPEKTTTYTYDKAGRLITAADGTITLSYAYDTASRLESVTRSDGKIIEKTYDDAGNLVQRIYPDGYYLTYTYDSLNRLEQILESGTLPLAQYEYDSLSRRSTIILGNGTVSTYAYEPDSDVSAILHQFNAESVTFDYTYNRVGSRISFSSTDDRFLYQPLTNDTKDYTTNNLNQYTAINAETLTHDLNGNLTANGINTYIYDPENRLAQVITPSMTTTYSSDPMGRRQGKTVNAATTNFLYDGDNVIMEFDGSGTLIRRFVYGPGVDDPVCMINPTGRYFYHADALGSVAALSDGAGNLEETYAYSPFGGTNTTGTLGNPYRFTGRRLDPESGLYYYRARHYDAESGRFVQPDPIGFAGGINLYAYVLNNPVNWIDPWGLWTLQIGVSGSGGAGAGGTAGGGFVFGFSWNNGFQFGTYEVVGGGGFGGVGGSGVVDITFSTNTDINDLSGLAGTVGGSGGEGVSFGGEVNIPRVMWHHHGHSVLASEEAHQLNYMDL